MEDAPDLPPDDAEPRLTREQEWILRHPIRQRIHRAILASPGLALIGLSRSLGVSWGTLAFHLRALARVGLVTFRNEEGHRRVYPGPASPPRRAPPEALLLKDAATRAFAVELCRTPGNRLSEVAQALHQSPCIAHHHLRRLARHHLVAVSPDRRLSPSPALQRLVAGG